MTPESVRKEIARFGGLNPFGGANWRVVLAETRTVLRGRGLPPADEVIRTGMKVTAESTGLHRVPKYPVKGWIIERWFAPNKYSEVQWKAARCADGITPLMGPFPHEGEYFMLAGPFTHIPPLEDIKAAITLHIREEEQSPKGYNEMLRAEMVADWDRDEAAALKAERDLAYFYESVVKPVLKGSSLEAQRIRTEMAEKMGDWSHQGVA